MYPDIFRIATDSAEVTALLGEPPDDTRLWPFGRSKGPNDKGYGVPYAVHQLVYGNPSNNLSCPPSEDMLGVQVDCYANSVSSARSVSAALRDAIEDDYNHVVAWNGEDFEPATGLWRVSFTAEFFVDRGS